MRYVVERASTKYIDKRKPCDEAIPADMIQDSALRILKTEGIENLPEECRYEHNWYIEINTLEELMEFTKKYCNAIVIYTYDNEFDEYGCRIHGFRLCEDIDNPFYFDGEIVIYDGWIE